MKLLPALAVVYAVSGCKPGPAEPTGAEIKAKMDAQAASVAAGVKARNAEECKSELPAQIPEFDRLMREKNYPAAVLALKKCALATDRPDLIAKVRAAEVRVLVATIEDPSSMGWSRDEAIRELSTIDPGLAEKHKAKLPEYEARASAYQEKARLAAAADLRRKKRREGVSIGMSQQDVLDSSWGRPQKVNKSTTVYGVREQWVYGGGNYLYFEDGVLTTIHH